MGKSAVHCHFLYHLYIRNDGLTIKNGYPLVMKKAIENGHLGRWFTHKKMVVFYSYVSLPEGI